jgi:hypothetical protein
MMIFQKCIGYAILRPDPAKRRDAPERGSISAATRLLFQEHHDPATCGKVGRHAIIPGARHRVFVRGD